jgi:hypothetical protein
MNWGYNVEITFIRRIITTYKRNVEQKLQKNNIHYINSLTSSGLLMGTY